MWAFLCKNSHIYQHWVTNVEFVTLVHLHIAQLPLFVLYERWKCIIYFFFSVDNDLILSNKITSDTQPLIRVGFILVMPDVSWWPSAPTLQNLLKWINTLKIHILIFSLQEQNSSNEFWSLRWSDGIPNDHSLVFAHMTVVWMPDSPWSSLELKWRSISEPLNGLLLWRTSHTDEFIWWQTPVFKKYTITAYCTVIILFKVIKIVNAPHSKTQNIWSCLNGLHYYTKCL